MSLSDFILTAIFTASGILAGWSLRDYGDLGRKCAGRANSVLAIRNRIWAALSQALTRNVGYPKLRDHLGAVVAYMT
jgi:hypothetical protein